jgi:hypothetical protein
MKEIINIHDAKSIMKKKNIIIYGTIRDIEDDFLSSFTNLDLISSYFNKVYIIILENDSSDKTRELLIEWSNINIMNVTKHLILKDNVDLSYSLRAHRLSYCRNLILNYISDNILQNTYEYVIHCDLDNRFWSVNYESICNCFQYDLNAWDMMSCVSNNKTYYDFWALRCESSWFNMNIFSCETNGINYCSKVGEFETLLKNTNCLIPTTSSFNGLAIYKLTSIIYCRYNAEYKCYLCNNTNRGCWEDNDHIGLHKQMNNNNCKLFINNKMYIKSRPENAIPYKNFINSIYIPNIKKNPLNYLLINDLIEKNGYWIMIGPDNNDNTNLITNYYDDSFYYFNQTTDESSNSLFNKNVIILNDNYNKSLKDGILSSSSNPNSKEISFIYINLFKYNEIKMIFDNLYSKIKVGCIIIFDKLINYKEYLLNGLKVLYENIYEYGLEFEWLMMNGEIKTNNFFSFNNSESVAIKIIANKYNLNNGLPYFTYSSQEFDEFVWNVYIDNYNDLKHIQSKEEAFCHWKNYGEKEGRICKPNESTSTDILTNTNLISSFSENDENFDWEMYLELNPDLIENDYGITKEDAYHHWINHGKNEGRMWYFDWCLYIKNYNLVSKSIDTKIKAIRHWIDNGRPILSNKTKDDYDYELFDWQLYVGSYEDLKHIDSRELAWSHWINFGKQEGRIPHNFKWSTYLLLNNDLIEAGINTEDLALSHYIKHGIHEKRRINL